MRSCMTYMGRGMADRDVQVRMGYNVKPLEDFSLESRNKSYLPFAFTFILHIHIVVGKVERTLQTGFEPIEFAVARCDAAQWYSPVYHADDLGWICVMASGFFN